ncbi:MAG: L-aspartate oxidase [Planctomycetes bacterium]|nr:L-aspartate oxidase [Planctomycetota bacterium]
MSSVVARRRYLTNFEVQRLPHLFTDVLVLGSGIAGLRAALAAADECDVVVVTKDDATLSASSWAQGGIAAARAGFDSTDQHAEDTLRVACELGDAEVTQEVVTQAPRQIDELVSWGVRFDREGPDLAVGREGGHSASRILHADGDATGREIIRVLLERARAHPRIRIFERCFAIDLLTGDSRVVGALTHHAKYGHQMFWATTTILASGGVGRVFRETTNPPIATGDGLAMALRAGAILRDMEMVQFHPTTLYVAGAARALISEAVRGEGAYLVDRDGGRFMERYDPRGELASRDVVSRAIHTEMRRLQQPCMYLDVRHFQQGHFSRRFPSLARLCADFDIEPEHDLIPVRPSAHYTVGGVVTNRVGETTLPGLLAAGEVASTGLHGANRLASNSLLEGLVFGKRCGELAVKRSATHPPLSQPLPLSHRIPQSMRTELDLDDVLNSLQSVMGRNVSIERSGDRLRETIEIIEFWSRYVLDKVFDAPRAWETQNLLSVALCIATAAATRCESRGTHYRSDFPQSDGAWRCHIDIRRADDRLQVSTTPAAETT